MSATTERTYTQIGCMMSIEKITEKLVKTTIGMIENNDDGIILPLDLLLAHCPDLPIDDKELLHVTCKVAAETATRLSSHFTREIVISFVQREQFQDGEYVPDCSFEFAWAL